MAGKLTRLRLPLGEALFATNAKWSNFSISEARPIGLQYGASNEYFGKVRRCFEFQCTMMRQTIDNCTDALGNTSSRTLTIRQAELYSETHGGVEPSRSIT